jgi:hypothetical protein
MAFWAGTALCEPPPGVHIPVDAWLPALQAASAEERLGLLEEAEAIPHVGREARELYDKLRARVDELRGLSHQPRMDAPGR